MSLPELQSIINRVLGGNADPASSSTTASAHAKLNQVLSLLPSTGVSAVQYGSITTTTGGVTTFNATISNVDTTKSTVVYLGHNVNTNAIAPAEEMGYLQLLNSTTVQLTTNGAGSYTITVYFAVMTFTAATSVQQGTIAIPAAATSATASITSVTVGRSICFYLGMKFNANNNNIGEWFCAVTLTNSTTVTASRGMQTNVDSPTVGYAVVAF